MHSIPVKDIMTTPVITVTPETLVMDAADLMDAHNIRRVPVVNDDGQIRGMLTDTDVIEAETAEYASNAYDRNGSAEWVRVADVIPNAVSRIMNLSSLPLWQRQLIHGTCSGIWYNVA